MMLKQYTIHGATILTLLLGCMVATGMAADNETKREIAITFDELPVAESFREVDTKAIFLEILNTLDSHDVKATGFVVARDIGIHYDLIGEWLNRKHRLGNLTYSHADYNDLDIQSFIGEIEKGKDSIEYILSSFGQKQRYFRYPFLHYGQSIEARRQAQMYLEESGVTVAHATVVIEDYLYNLTMQQINPATDTSRMEQLRYEYVSHVLDQVKYAEQLSRELLGRNCRHIVQLQMNELNAWFLDAILTSLKDMGYSFISLDKALQDKVYKMPEAYYGMRGVSYLEMIRQSDPDLTPAR